MCDSRSIENVEAMGIQDVIEKKQIEVIDERQSEFGMENSRTNGKESKREDSIDGSEDLESNGIKLRDD